MPDDLEVVPTVADLVQIGEAHRVGTGHYRLTQRGHALIGEVMARNGARWRAWRTAGSQSQE